MNLSNKQKGLRHFVYRLWFEAVEKLLTRRGHQYVGEEDHALTNFIEAAGIWDSSIPSEILHWATKHWVFLVDWVKKGADEMREKARVSALDMIVYMVLLLFWLQLVGEPSIIATDVKVPGPKPRPEPNPPDEDTKSS